MGFDLKLALGILGNATAVALFGAPLPTFWDIVRQRSTQEYSGLPYVCTLFNCMLWILYGMPFVKPHSMLIITINVAGCAIEVVYISLYLTYAIKLSKVKVMKMLAAVAVAFSLLTVVTMTLVHTHAARTTVVGSVCVAVAIVMYISPLSVMKLVIQTKSVQYMPFLLSLFVFLNSLVWTFYAIVTKDIFIAIPNGLGCLSGMAQLGLYVYYRNSKPNLEHDGKATNMYENALCIQMDQAKEKTTQEHANQQPASST